MKKPPDSPAKSGTKPRPPAFKNSELGPIPADWEVKAIEEFYEIGSSKRVFQSQWRSDGIPFYRARDIVGFRRGEKAIGGLFIDKSLYEEFKRTYGVPSVGDLLVTAVGTLGDVFRVCDESPFYFKDGNIIWFKSSGKYDSRLLEILFDSGFLDAQIYDTAGGSTVGTYTISNAKKTLIPCPPLPEQRRIAAALSDADAWIESLDKLIEKKKLVKQGAMQALLSGKTRLPGFAGEWVERRLGEIGEFRKGAGISREEGRSGIIPAVRYGELYTHHDCIIRAFGSHISEAVASRATLLKSGDILFACSGETKEEIGKCAAFIQPVRAYAGGDLLIMTPDPALCDSTFMGYALNSAKCQAQKSAAGQGDAVVHLHKDALEELEIRLPPTLAEQSAIATVLSDMDAELASLFREKAKAEQIKQGMMQELLTGRVRLAGGE